MKKSKNKRINEYGHRLKKPPTLMMEEELSTAYSLKRNMRNSKFSITAKLLDPYHPIKYPKKFHFVFKIIRNNQICDIELLPGRKGSRNIKNVSIITPYLGIHNWFSMEIEYKKKIPKSPCIIFTPHIDFKVLVDTNEYITIRLNPDDFPKSGTYRCQIISQGETNEK